MPAKQCPTQDELRTYAQRMLPVEQAEELTKHIAKCQNCEETVQEIASASSNNLVALIKASDAAQPYVDEPACLKVVESVKRNGPAAAGPSAPGAAAGNNPPNAETKAARTMNRNEFVEFITTVGFVSAGEITVIDKQLPAEKAGDVQTLAQALVQQGKLTKFQAAAVYQGKGKSLVYGDYLVLDRLGAGGMGQVFKARHRRLDRIVALKVLSPAAMKSPDSVKRFEREARAAAKLIHPNIVHTYDAGAQDNIHYLVMELVSGPDLSSLVKKQGKLDLKLACDYITQAARGFAFAHSKGIVHRDIKPGNLLVDHDGTVKVLDMGLARFDDAGLSGGMGEAELTQSGAVMGTVDYMAPEQALNTSRADAKSDVYGLGCTLYRILTGESVFAGDTLMEKLLAHREQPIPKLRRVRPDAPPALEALVSRMLSKKPEERPTMQEVADALPGTLEPGSAVQPVQVRTPAVATAGVPSMVAVQPKPKGAVPPKKRSSLPLFAAAGAGGLLILGGILFVIRDKDGNKIAEVNAPDGSSVAVQAAPTIAPPPVIASTASPKPIVAVTPTATASMFTSTKPAVPEATAIATSTTPTPTATPATVTPATTTATVVGSPVVPPTGGIPARAVAPFDVAQAKSLQASWAAFLGQPEVAENAIGMKLALIPAGEFQMGATHGQQQPMLKAAETAYEREMIEFEVPQHRVVLRSAYRIGTTEVTIGEFRRFVEATKYVTECEEPANADPSDVGRVWNNPSYPVTDRHPVTCVSWNDAVAFCNWLSESEGLQPAYKREGKWSWSAGTTSNGYRLPTEAEWEFACRAGTTSSFWFGESIDDVPVHAVADKGVAVATKPANPFGLFDTSGNIQEWCQDINPQKPYDAGPAEDPTGATSGNHRVIRGGSWREPRSTFRSTHRGGYPAKSRNFHTGFRVVKVIGAAAPQATTLAPAGAPARAVAPFNAAQAKSLQEAWAAALKQRVLLEISGGMRLTLIPPGEFLMGSTSEQQAAAKRASPDAKLENQYIDLEAPQHRVVLRNPFRIGIAEVTVREFREFVEATKYVTECEVPGGGLPSDLGRTWRAPGYPVTDHCPATFVSWNDACAFCNWLSEREGLQPAYRKEASGKWIAGTTLNGYRLPTDAEWEYACRAGTTTLFWYGDDFAKIPEFAVTTQGSEVAKKPANPFGLYDTSGNVWELCHDNHEPYEPGTAEDPIGPTVGGSRAIRGGAWHNDRTTYRSAYRLGLSPISRNNHTGFRVVKVLDPASPVATTIASTTSPATTTSLPATPAATIDPAATSNRSSPAEILAFDFDPLPQELAVGQSPTMEFRVTNSKSQDFPLTGTYHHSDLAAFKPVAAVQVRLQCLEPGPDALLAATDYKKAPMTTAGIVLGAPRISSTNKTLTSGETVKGTQPLKISGLPVGRYVMTVTCVPSAGLGRNQYASYEFRIVDQPAATQQPAQVTWSLAPPALLAAAPRLLPITDPERRAVLWALPLGAKMQIVHLGLNVGPNPLPDDAFTLRNIDFYENASNNESRHMVTDADLENLVGLKEIKQLRLNYGQITDVGLKHLAGLTTLSELNLSDTKVGDAGIAKLAALKDIRALRLNRTLIGDAGLEKIVAQFPMVNEPLEVDETLVTDAGVAHLRNAQYVRFLGLAGTDVSDDCIQHLAVMPRLGRVNLIGTRVTEAGMAKLKATAVNKNLEVGFDPTKVKTGPRTTQVVAVPFASTTPTTATPTTATAPTTPVAGTPASAPAGETPAAPAGPSRLAVPDAKAQQAALQLIKDVYKDDYTAARVPDKKAELAEKLLEQSTQTTDPTDRYVLLNEARTFALDGDNQPLLRRVLTAIATDYDVDTATIYIDSWKGVLAKSRPAAVAKGIYDEITTMFESAVAQGAFDEAKRFGDYALMVAPRIGDATAVKSTRDRNTLVAARQQEWNAAKAALAKLASLPDDPDANLIVGRYRAGVETDWPTAFSHLAKSSDETWKDLATKSITVAADGAARATLADAFWDASTKAKGAGKAEFAAGALYWYQAAQPSLNGLQKARIEKRVAEATAAVPAKKLPPTVLGAAGATGAAAAPSSPTPTTTTPATAATPAVPAGLAPDDPRGPFGNAAYQKWMKEVQALPMMEQVPAVSKKMKELNPGFDGVIRSRTRDGYVYDIGFSTDNVSNIYPIRALSKLEEINCGSSVMCQLTDLTPLQGMRLKKFFCEGPPVVDLSPLRGMPLEVLSVSKTQVADISVLAGMPLKTLNIDSTQVFDLSPLQNCKQLTSLTRVGSRVQPEMMQALKQVLPNCEIK